MTTVETTPARAGAGDVGAGDLTAEVAALVQLDAAALRRRWRDLVGGSVPADLGSPLTLRVLAYRLQARRLGDLDRASLPALAALAGPAKAPVSEGLDDGASGEAPMPSTDGVGGASKTATAGRRTRPAPARPARPGTVLVREHGGVPHRVTVLAGGVSWNGRTYDSLSQVAFAITGTRWNGPHFFGLRDAPSKTGRGDRPSRAGAELAPVTGRGRAVHTVQPSLMRSSR